MEYLSVSTPRVSGLLLNSVTKPLWSVRKAIAEDVAYLAPRLCEADIAECRAATGMSTYDALMAGLSGAEVVLDQTSTPIAIFGVARQDAISGLVWLTATPTITKPPYLSEFIRHSRGMCDRLNDGYPPLCNVVDARNALHIRWLKWCGFIFINHHQSYGPEKRPFYEFIRIRKSCVTP
jgi:hypothetical protein